jgi:hypothetical protein
METKQVIPLFYVIAKLILFGLMMAAVWTFIPHNVVYNDVSGEHILILQRIKRLPSIKQTPPPKIPENLQKLFWFSLLAVSNKHVKY